MGFESSTGLGVYNYYGPRDSGKTSGVYEVDGSQVEASIVVDSDMIGGTIPQVLTLPAGAKVTAVYAKVTEAFVLGGTTPTISIGTEGTETTNGADVSEAQAEAIGTYDITGTLAGTWTSQLAAATAVGLALGGTTPTKTSVGKVQFVIKYIQLP